MRIQRYPIFCKPKKWLTRWLWVINRLNINSKSKNFNYASNLRDLSSDKLDPNIGKIGPNTLSSKNKKQNFDLEPDNERMMSNYWDIDIKLKDEGSNSRKVLENNKLYK